MIYINNKPHQGITASKCRNRQTTLGRLHTSSNIKRTDFGIEFLLLANENVGTGPVPAPKLHPQDGAISNTDRQRPPQHAGTDKRQEKQGKTDKEDPKNETAVFAYRKCRFNRVKVPLSSSRNGILIRQPPKHRSTDTLSDVSLSQPIGTARNTGCYPSSGISSPFTICIVRKRTAYGRRGRPFARQHIHGKQQKGNEEVTTCRNSSMPV